MPVSASALGLGKLTVGSGLGQPLAAEIDLIVSQQSELDSLSARIGDLAAYRAHNVQYQAAAARVRVALERRDGRPVLRLTTAQPVNEPYLDLLVEVNWAAGRALREYTFLLDPPGYGSGAPIDPITPAQVRPLPATPRPAPVAAAPAAAPAPARATGETYGPVRRGETLYSIASQTRPEGVSVEQMLIALYRANPNAFEGNVNRMLAGARLSIPRAEQVGAVTQAEAERELRVQANDWRAYRNKLAAAAPTVGGEEPRQAVAGRVTAAGPDRGAGAQPAGDTLRISKGEAVAGGAAARGAAADDLAAKDRALTEANQRLAQLERQVQELQRLLELRSGTMAETQRSAQGAPGAEAPRAEAGKSVAPAVPPGATGTTSQAQAPAAAPAPAPAAAPAAAPAPAPSPVAKAEPAKTPPKAKAAPAPLPEPSIWDDLASNPLLLAGVGGIGVLGGLWWLLSRRRRPEERSFEPAAAPTSDMRASTVFGSSGGGVVNTGESSLVSDFSREGLGSIDTGEVDPIAEAEVYLAYGREAQAEEILKDALEKDPDRNEIRAKLLEIYHQQKKAAAFESVATELYTATQGEGEAWAKAAALGSELDPENPLYRAEPSVRPRGAEAAASGLAAATAGIASAASGLEAARRGTPPKEEVFVVPPALTEEPKAEGDRPLLEFESSGRPPANVRSAETGSGAKPGGIAEKVDSPRPPPPEHDLDFRLDDALAAAAPVIGGAAPAKHLEAGEGEKAAREAAGPERSPTPSVLDGQWHDAATKLDLAKAYQEMGDLEGAREILQEVMREGDESQKKEAQAFLSKLTA